MGVKVTKAHAVPALVVATPVTKRGMVSQRAGGWEGEVSNGISPFSTLHQIIQPPGTEPCLFCMRARSVLSQAL